MRVARYLATALLLITTHLALAGDKEVTFQSNPSGAQVEIDGRIIGTTPVTYKFKSYCFGRKSWAFSAHLNRSIVARFTKEGYAPKTVPLTDGPIQWASLNGMNRYEYYLVRSTEFTVQLERIEQFFPGTNPSSPAVQVAVVPGQALSTEEIAKRAIPAVALISTPKGSGGGFFISPNGVIATNAHVVEGQQTVIVVTSSGKALQSESIYVDSDRDLALIKVSGQGYPFLDLADLNTIGSGSEVVAIGSPGVGGVTLTNTVTRGVVGGVRKGDHGTWIQTDTAINPGNSGGPLLNNRGEVVGVNTMKIVAPGISGINFALASSELQHLLQTRFNYTPPAKPSQNFPRVSVAVASTPAGADIEVDGLFVGSTPSDIMVEQGIRTIRITKKGFAAFERKMNVEPGSKPSVTAELEQTK